MVWYVVDLLWLCGECECVYWVLCWDVDGFFYDFNLICCLVVMVLEFGDWFVVLNDY